MPIYSPVNGRVKYLISFSSDDAYRKYTYCYIIAVCDLESKENILALNVAVANFISGDARLAAVAEVAVFAAIITLVCALPALSDSIANELLR